MKKNKYRIKRVSAAHRNTELAVGDMFAIENEVPPSIAGNVYFIIGTCTTSSETIVWMTNIGDGRLVYVLLQKLFEQSFKRLC